jgi:Tfp pilus assembly protein PilN
MRELNLAARPFLNPRPVLRVSVLLWVLGVAVAAFNVRLYMKHYSGSSADRGREQELEATLESERARVRDLRTEFEGYDVDWQNEQAKFLNAKIAERSFPWSELFDRLGETLPADVRLNTLSPSFGEGRGGKVGLREGEALLVIRGQAKSSEVVLEFIDALFAHPKFRAPDLGSEALKDTGLLDFGLSVIYRADSGEPEPPVDDSAGATEDGATEAVEGGPATEAGEAGPTETGEAGSTKAVETGAPANPTASAPEPPAKAVSE